MKLDELYNFMNLTNPSLDWLAKALFPVRCVGCGAFDRYLCVECGNKIKPPASICPLAGCLRLTNRFQFCSHHRKQTILSGIFHGGSYRESLLRWAIWEWKYQSVKGMGDALALLAAASFGWQIPRHSTLCPIPLHRLRERARGFNQAEQLAAGLGEILNLPVKNYLQRTRQTQEQARLGSDERRANVSDAFALVGRPQLKGQTIILVDDVATTFATLEAAAQALKRRGARRVFGAVIALG